MIKNLERTVERGLFASRWLMAPFYVGLALSLVLLLYGFALEFMHFAANIASMQPSDIILGVLSLIDLSLAGNLLVIVIFAGYENTVSQLDVSDHEDMPAWKGSVDFSTLKLKLAASIVAISAIHLLKLFMNVDTLSEHQLKWATIIHMVFVVSGVLLALMDRIAASTKSLKK